MEIKYKSQQIVKLQQKYSLNVASKRVRIAYSQVQIFDHSINEKDENCGKQMTESKKKSKKSRRLPDADVVHISDLFSNNLLIISPEKAISDNVSIRKNDGEEYENDNSNSTVNIVNTDIHNTKNKLVSENNPVAKKLKNKSEKIKYIMSNTVESDLVVKPEKSTEDAKTKNKSKLKKNKQKLSLRKNKNDKETEKVDTAKNICKENEEGSLKLDLNSELATPKINNVSDGKEDKSSTEKKNAFKFMMDSRYKSIGMNSPGKERLEENVSLAEISEKKNQLEKRKLFLGEWADIKGGTKRQIDEEAKDKFIEKTLNKRKKRLKNMLSCKKKDTPLDYDNISEDLKPKRKRLKMISDSESSNDSVILSFNSVKTEKPNEENVEKNEKIKFDYSKEDVIFTSPNNLNKSLKTAEKQDTEDKIDILLSPSLKKTSLLHYFDVTNKEKDNIIETDELLKNKNDKQEMLQVTDNIESSELIKIKLNFTPKKSSDKNESLDEHTLASKKSKKIKKKHRHSLSLRTKDENGSKENINENEIKKLRKNITPDEKNNFKSDSKLLSEEKLTEKSCKKEDCMTPNNKKENKLQFTPRTWRMKVRLFEKDELESEKLSDVSDDVIICDEEIVPIECSKSIGSVLETKKSDINSDKLDVKKDIKIAPLFLIHTKKSEMIAANEAKQKFLHSGVPLKMKKMMTKQKSENGIMDLEPLIFPQISHIQQREENLIDFWDLPNTSLILPEIDEEDCKIGLETIHLGTITDCKTISETSGNQKYTCVTTLFLPNLKSLIKELKKECPQYPVYSIFRTLQQKYGIRNNKSIISNQEVNKKENRIEPEPKVVKRKRGRPRKKKDLNSSIEIVDLDASDISSNLKNEMPPGAATIWTDKYKPQSSNDIIGNSTGVKELKNWLLTWVEYSAEQNATIKKRKRLNSNSSDDFCCDSDTRDTDTIPQNTIMLIGPCGSGKTSTVYAICNELNLNVIEINASSRRWGKKILSDLQEATKSHQVKNADSSSVNTFFQKISQENCNNQDDEISKRLTLLLIEDADIVFEDQDEGFINAVTTLISSSKRPIIITSSDPKCAHLQKLLSQHQVITFNALSSKLLGTWLQILCLVEGIRVNKTELSKLLDWNRGDMRKTILQLQFWVLSGGDLSKKLKNKILSRCLQPKTSRKNSVESDIQFEDESSNLSWLSAEESQVFNSSESEETHYSCLECFIPYYKKDMLEIQLPYPSNLGILWWNMPNILGIKNMSHNKIFTEFELKPLEDEASEKNKHSEIKMLSNTSDSEPVHTKPKLCDLNAVGNLLDVMAFTDILYTRMKYETDIEPYSDYWRVNPTDSLSFEENMSDFKESRLISYELTQWLIENSVKHFHNASSNNLVDMDFNHAVPVTEERRWRKKQHLTMEGLSEAIPATNQLDRRNSGLDYYSTLRTICRSEQIRFILNNKRKNRFYHYLKGLNVTLTDTLYETVCNTLAHC